MKASICAWYGKESETLNSIGYPNGSEYDLKDLSEVLMIVQDIIQQTNFSVALLRRDSDFIIAVSHRGNFGQM